VGYPIKAGRTPDEHYCGIWFGWHILPGALTVRYRIGDRLSISISDRDMWRIGSPYFSSETIFCHQTGNTEDHFWDNLPTEDCKKLSFIVHPMIKEAFDQVGIKAEEWETWTDEQKAHLRLLLP
jgi:hypothetical protein